MPRIIASQDPVTIAATNEKVYNNMKLADFRVYWDGEKTRLHAKMINSDFDGKLSPVGRMDIKISDLEEQIAVTPKFSLAWDLITDVMGLAYDFYVLQGRVEDDIANGRDSTENVSLRNAALIKLREPV